MALRDRKTLLMMLLLPLLLFPLLISVSTFFISSHEERARTRRLQVGVVDGAEAGPFMEAVGGDSVGFTLLRGGEAGRELLMRDSLDAVVVFSTGFGEEVSALGAGGVELVYRGTTENEIEVQRARRLLSAYGGMLREERFLSLGLAQDVDSVLDVEETDLATPREHVADLVGGMLPYMFVIFCLMGSMYPALDLGAGEKERGTLEPLLTAPVSRFGILLGKFGVVVATGVTSALVSLLGLYLGIRYVSAFPGELVDMVMTLLRPGSIVFLLSLLLPLTALFAGLLLTVSFTSGSYREAQSKAGPLFPAVIVPAFIGIMPGMSLSPVTALVPVLNVSLASRAILAGRADPLSILIVYVSLVACALGALALCSRTFGRESTVLG